MYFISDLLCAHPLLDAQGDNFELACVAQEWHIQDNSRSFVLTDDAKLGCSADAAFPNSRIFQIEEMRSSFPKGYQVIDRALLNLSRLPKYPFDAVFRDQADWPFLFFCPNDRLGCLLEPMEEQGLLRIDISSQRAISVALTPKGWERVHELSERPSVSRQAFVAMWFTDEMNTLYKEAIVPAIERAGFSPRKIDQVQHNNEITDEIVAEIRKSRFLVADFTAGSCGACKECKDHVKCKDRFRPRGGVYYEAGFAKGLGLEVIWLVQKDQLEHVHFDVRQRNFIDYTNAEDLKTRLYNRIAATI